VASDDVASDGCTFRLLEASVSPAIGTVGIVRFALPSEIAHARIEFGLADGSGEILTSEVNLDAVDYRSLMLGMKGDREYAFTINVDDGRCVSPRYTLTTEPVPNWIPRVERQVLQPDAASRGF